MDDPSSDGARTVIYIVDDDPSVRDSLAQLMRSMRLESQQFESAEQFLNEFRQDRLGCLIVDVRMSGMDGISLCEKLAAEKISIPIIVISGHGDLSMRERAMKSGIVDFLEKPCNPEKLVAAVRVAVAQGEKQTGR